MKRIISLSLVLALLGILFYSSWYSYLIKGVYATFWQGRTTSDPFDAAYFDTKPVAASTSPQPWPIALTATMAPSAATQQLLDASQTAGHCPIDVGADAIACSAHKALLGPPGLGVLACRDGLPMRSAKQGGTGSSRALDQHPTEWPTAFEAGTPNTPAIYGLDAALALATKSQQSARLDASLAALAELQARIERDSRFVVFAPRGPRMPVLSFVRRDLDPSELAAILDAADVHVRAGHHCAPWIHRFLGSELAGTVRVSPGPEITADDILRVSEALAS
jgi:selenocysteine lyase/cysteine desulfurase